LNKNGKPQTKVREKTQRKGQMGCVTGRSEARGFKNKENSTKWGEQGMANLWGETKCSQKWGQDNVPQKKVGEGNLTTK